MAEVAVSPKLFEPVEQQSALFEQPVNPAVVPKNVKELAAQVAAVDESQLTMPFSERMAAANQQIVRQGASAVVSDIALKERDEHVAALRTAAETAAKAGNGSGLQSAALMIRDAQAKAAPTFVEGSDATAKRALEQQGIQYASNRYRSLEQLDAAVQREGDLLSLRNVVAHESAKLEGQTGMWDRISNFFTAFLPFVHDYRVNRAISETTGIDRYFDTEGAVNDFRSFFRGLGPDERISIVHKLAEQQVGAFGENKAGSLELLRKLSEMTKADANVDILFNALGVTDVATLSKGLFNLVRSGTPLKGLFRVAGEKPAADLAVTDLLAGNGASGLNNSELMGKALAMGKNPFDVDPAAFSGLSSAIQGTLRTAFDDLLAASRNRLISSGLSEEEIKLGLADIRAKYSVDTNKAIHSVTFGEGDELGQQMTVLWQGPDGKAFASREAADSWAKAEGKVDYVVVPRNTADASVLRSEVKWTDVAADRPASGRADAFKESGNVLVTTRKNPSQINTLFDEIGYHAGGDPMATQLADVWKNAAKGGHSSVSADRLLHVIATQSSDDDFRFLAQHLMNTKTAKGVRWDKVPVELHWNIGASGDYNILRDEVRVALHHGANAETILHELIHAHNSQAITLVASSPKLAKVTLTKEAYQAAERVVDLHKRLNEWWHRQTWKEREQHGSLAEVLGKVLPDVHLKEAMRIPAELVTYGLTRTSVRDALSKIKLKDLGYHDEAGTVWSEIWDSFKALLGLRANDTALAKLFDNYSRLAEGVVEKDRTAFTGLVERGTLNAKDVVDLTASSFLKAKGEKGPQSIVKMLEKEVTKVEKLVAAGGGEKQEARLAQLRMYLEQAKAKAGGAVDAGPSGEWLVQERRADPISNANIGKFSDEDIRSMPWIAIDPKHGASEQAIEARVVGVHAEAKMRRDLTKFLEPFFDKLTGAGKSRVKAVLEEGDAASNVGSVGKEFNYSELRGKGLNEEEAAAYFAARQVRMVSYHIRNGEMVRALRADGMREIELLTTGEKHAGKVLAQEDAGQSLGKVVYDYTTGKAVLMDSTKLEDAYKAGQKVVQFKQPVEFGGKHYYHAIVDDSVAKAREITAALHYRPGEFSRIYTDQYFITVRKVVEVDGKMQEIKETVRTAASTREAQEYVEAHRRAIQLLLDNQAGKSVPKNLVAEVEKLIGKYQDPEQFVKRFDAGELNGYVGMDFHYTRNAEEFLNGSISEAMTNGRLFTSQRSSKLFSVDRDRTNIKDVYQSLEHEITNISRVANISQWRETTIRRWMNTFGHMLPNRTGNDVADFIAAAGAKFTRGTQDAQFAERTHDYIMRQIGVRTSEERMYEGVTRMLTEKLFTGNERIESIGAKIRTMKWLNFIRNANFNLNLGMFNPAQLLVQANGAATALILSPLHGAKAAMTFPLLRMALMSDNPEVWSRFARMEKFKNLGLSNEGEFVELVKAIRKSGIIDNVRSTSLWNTEDGALNVFGGYPQRLAKSNTVFFNRGEEFSRVVSFDVARREWMAKNPSGIWNTDAALKDIIVRMDDLTQNMTKANLARFQEGIMSIPLQFAQYNIKLAANVMTSAVKPGRGFSRAEAIQLLLGHVALYGAAGNGLVWAMDEVLGEDLKNKLSPKVKEVLSQGLVSWAVDNISQHVTGQGAKVALGSRLGSFNYYEQLAEAAFTDKTGVYEAILGPTVASAKRLGVIAEVFKLWHKDPDLTGRDILEGLGHMGTEQVASLRNATKAYLFMQHQGKMLDRQGVAIGQLNMNEMLWQALGFQPTVAVDVNNLIKSKHDHAQAIDDITKLIMRVQKDIVTAENKGDYERANEQRKLLQALWPNNAGDTMEVQKRIRDRLFPYDSEFQKLLGERVWKGATHNKPVIVTEEPRKVQ